MPILHNSIVPAADSTPADPVTRSLRFDANRSDSSLHRTFSSGSETNWTFSVWYKRTETGATDYIFNTGSPWGGYSGGTNNSNNQKVTNILVRDTNKLRVYAYNGSVETNVETDMLFRDPSAWYHIFISWDSSQSSGSRYKIFVNGEEVSCTHTADSTNFINRDQTHGFGFYSGNAPSSNLGNRWPYMAGYLADCYFIDGTTLSTPVGNTIEATGYGSYKPKAFNMSSYSGNSFHIDAQPLGSDAELLVTSIDRNDGDTLFADAAKGRDVNVRGTPHHSIAVGNPFTGDGRAIKFGGTNPSLTTSTSTDFAIASGDSFTAECWVFINNHASNTFDGIFSGYASSNLGWVIEINNGYWGVYDSNAARQVSSTAATTGEWHHVALVKTDDSTDGARLYLNGNKIDDVTISSNTTSAHYITLGAFYVNDGYSMDGYMFDARFTKGEELYTGSTYTVPASALEKGDNTKLLIQPDKDDSSIGDKSDSNHTISTNGTITYTASTPYDAAAKSTAIRLDSESLITETQMDFAIGSSDTFTAEGWFYLPSSLTQHEVFFSTRHGGADHGWQLNVDTSANYWSFYSYPSGSAQDTTVALPSTGEWFHLAVVKNSSSTDGVSVYVNGAFKFTVTDGSNRTAASSLTIGDYWGAGHSAAYAINAYVYDIRFTKNETRYSGTSTSEWGNFDEITAPLELNPVYIGGDQSGNKNHFQPTGISSHDIMLDVPTANYPVLNPLQNTSANSTLSEGNLKSTWVANSGFNEPATIGATSGKYYFEVYVPDASATTNQHVGIVRANTANTVSMGAYQANTVAYMANASGQDSTGYLEYNGSSSAFGSRWDDASHIVQCAFDADTGKVWFGLDNTWQDDTSGNTPDLAAGTYPAVTLAGDEALIPAIRAYGDWMVFNGGSDPTFANNKTSGQDTSQSEFYYAPPNGFNSLNTSNLAAPSVTPSEHFEIAQWVGNETAGKVISTDISPDLVWIKNRDVAKNHTVGDSVRGANKALITNNTNTESTATTNITAFDTDESGGYSFTLGTSEKVNDSGKNHVGWVWKAHQSPTSSSTRTTYTVKVEDSSDDAWDDGSHYDSSTYLPSPYMEIFENRNGTLVSLGEVAVRTYDSSGASMSDVGEQNYTLECADLDAIAVKWHYDTSADGDEYDYPNSYNGYLNEQAITILDGSTSEWGTNNYSNDDGSSYNYSPPTGWADGDTLKSATTSYNGSDTATLTSDSGASDPVEKYNAAAGFTIISYSGDGSSSGDTQSLDHSLGVPLEFVIAKARTSNDSYDNGRWIVYHKDLTSGDYLMLNSTAAADTPYEGYDIISTSVSGSQHKVVVGNDCDSNGIYCHYLNSGPDNGTGEDYILYGWAGVEAYSKFGSYVGNGSSDGPMVYTGFRPRWIMVKPIDDPYAWYIHDTARSPYNYSDNELTANTSGAEYSVSGAGAGERFDILSNGFKHRTSNVAMNANNKTMIYAAFAESPFKYANAR